MRTTHTYTQALPSWPPHTHTYTQSHMYTYTHKSLGIVGYQKGKCEKAIKSAGRKGKKVGYKIYTDKQISEREEVWGKNHTRGKILRQLLGEKETNFHQELSTQRQYLSKTKEKNISNKSHGKVIYY